MHTRCLPLARSPGHMSLQRRQYMGEGQHPSASPKDQETEGIECLLPIDKICMRFWTTRLPPWVVVRLAPTAGTYCHVSETCRIWWCRLGMKGIRCSLDLVAQMMWHGQQSFGRLAIFWQVGFHLPDDTLRRADGTDAMSNVSNARACLVLHCALRGESAMASGG